MKRNPWETFNQKVVVTDAEPFEKDKFGQILFHLCPAGPDHPKVVDC